MKDTLNLHGDGDEIDLACDVEKIFGLKLTGPEWLPTVGQLYDFLEHTGTDRDRTRACLSQAAFYRLRRALMSMGANPEISPRTPISVINGLAPRSIVQKWRQLGTLSELTLPPLETPPGHWLPDDATPRSRWLYGLLVFLTIGACWFAMTRVVGLSAGWSLLCALVAGIAISGIVAALWHRWFGTVPHRVGTVGDLAREAAGHSYERLLAEKQGSAPSDRWFALLAILRRHSGTKQTISRETTFFAADARSER